MLILTSGINIYNAAVAGAKRGYNYTTNDHAAYEAAIKESFDCAMSDLESHTYDDVMEVTKGDWRNALLPLELLKMHKHVRANSGEWHVRVRIFNKNYSAIDIKLKDWNKLLKEYNAMSNI
jgi:hypothetical protein